MLCQVCIPTTKISVKSVVNGLSTVNTTVAVISKSRISGVAQRAFGAETPTRTYIIYLSMRTNIRLCRR